MHRLEHTKVHIYRAHERVFFVLGNIIAIGVIRGLNGAFVDVEDEALFTRYGASLNVDICFLNN